MEKIEAEELSILRSISNASQTSAKRHSYDIFGDYIANKLRKLSTIVDEDTMKNIEYEITHVLEENRRKFKSEQQSRVSYLSLIPPPPQTQTKEDAFMMPGTFSHTDGHKPWFM